jgi:hypothetical protein
MITPGSVSCFCVATSEPTATFRSGLRPGQPEVENLHAVVLGDKKILRLQVTMHDPFLVGGGKSTGDLLRIFNGLARSDCAIIQLCAKLFAFEQFGDDVRRASAFY